MLFHNLDACLSKRLHDTFMVLMCNQRSRSLASFHFFPPSSLPRCALLIKGIPCENPQTTLGKAKERPDMGERAWFPPLPLSAALLFYPKKNFSGVSWGARVCFQFIPTGKSGTDFPTGACNRKDGCNLPPDLSDPSEIPRRKLSGQNEPCDGKAQRCG